MKEWYLDIFAYHHHFNQKLGEQINANVLQVSERTIFLFSHIILAHQIWNARVLGQEPLDLHQNLSMDQCLTLDRSNFETTNGVIRDLDLDRSIIYRNTIGQAFKNTVKEILFHIANHSAHHKGQIVAALRQSGISPVVTDYIFYKRETRSPSEKGAT